MDKVMQTKVDVIDATKTYYGESQPGTATTAPNWRIRRALTTGGLVETNFPVPENTYGYPSSRYAFRWSDRAILNYTDSRDITTATLSTVTIASNNTDTTKAKVGDIVTLTIIASEALATISATIAGHAATIVAGADDAHYTATYTMVTGDTTGVVPFTIDFTDNAGNAGTQVTAVTGGASVTFDKTAPTATITYSASTVKSGDTLTITATFSEPLLDSPVVKIAIAGSNTVAATVMTKSTTQIYTYSHTVAAGNGASTVSLSVGTDTAGNIVTAAPTSGATFTVDNTLAVFTGVSVLSNNANTARAKSGDIVTAIFTTSEALQANPTVTFGAQAMTFGTLVGSTYTYTRTINGTETEGTANVLVTGLDIAGNTTTNTNTGNLTTDFTVPTLASVLGETDTQVTVTLSELGLTASITKANDGGFVVTDTASGLITYAVSAINPGATNDKVVITCATMAAVRAAGVTVTYVAGVNGTVADITGNLLATNAIGVATGAF